jgi:hypothetical protein
MVAKRKAPPHAFKPGQSGNVKGKPAGTRSKSTQLLLAMMEGGAEQITQAVIDAARGGDLVAAKIVLDRLIPPAKERPIQVDLPNTATVEGVAAAQNAILQAVADGSLLPNEGQTLSALVESKRRAIETQEMSDRISILEAHHGNNGKTHS